MSAPAKAPVERAGVVVNHPKGSEWMSGNLVAYCRVEAGGLSLEGQVERVRAYAHIDNAEIIGSSRDIKSIRWAHRLELDKAIAHAKRTHVRLVFHQARRAVRHSGGLEEADREPSQVRGVRHAGHEQEEPGCVHPPWPFEILFAEGRTGLNGSDLTGRESRGDHGHRVIAGIGEASAVPG